MPRRKRKRRKPKKPRDWTAIAAWFRRSGAQKNKKKEKLKKLTRKKVERNDD